MCMLRNLSLQLPYTKSRTYFSIYNCSFIQHTCLSIVNVFLNKKKCTNFPLISICYFCYQDTGYQCTITITRLADDVVWWYPACTKCNKASTPYQSGYKCQSCDLMAYRYRYRSILDRNLEATVLEYYFLKSLLT
jgi:hypothetical protein